MKNRLPVLLSLLLLAAPVRAQNTAPVTPYGNVVQNYTLAWSDEFNGAALDPANWDYRTDSKMWSTQQAQNVSVSNGHLVITLKSEHAEHKAFTGGGVISKRRFEFGYFEARFKVPPGSGWHTSFWAAPYGDPKTAPVAENDICEQDSVNPNSYSAGVIAWAEHARGIGRQYVKTPDLAEGFHVWGCELTPDKVRYFFDGKLTHEADVSHIKIGPANIWLTCIASGLGGTQYVNGKQLPATAEFDYVRYFQADAPAPATGAASAAATAQPPASTLAVELAVDGPGILTPPAPATPRINGPDIFGARPGSPFLYSIPATGGRPMTFAVEGLPEGLKVDASTGRITGSIAKAGDYPVTLTARNSLGENSKGFRIVIGEKIALTPPMGWNSWNGWGDSVNQAKVLSSAEALVATGLDQHGWTYINIDDGWQGPRGGAFDAIQPNPKFPDIAGLAEKLHGMGLKFGVYSTPWVMSYAGYVGSSCDSADGVSSWIASGDHNAVFGLKWKGDWRAEHSKYWRFGAHSFVVNDARQWAAWGVDYLKYDWHMPTTPPGTTEAMTDALRASGRDIVFSLSNSAPFAHANDWQRLANSWRTTGDITDTWESMKKNGFSQAEWVPFAGPGHWNDPDMLVVGRLGWGRPHPTHLTEDEQYTHVSLWCLLSSPLLIGCDLSKVDAFTLSLLSNDEVLAVDQDSLGREASPVMEDKDQAVYAKPLEDGSWAVGFFNLSSATRTVSVKWSDLKLDASRRVRDLWRQKDLGVFADGYSATVASHGVVLVRVFPASK